MTFYPSESFSSRHLGLSESEEAEMLQVIGSASLEQLVRQTIPQSIRLNDELDLPEAISEQDYIELLRSVADKNVLFKSYIGQGYSGTIVPAVLLRNIFENPGWYTQYTPYQAEISQGRLEALLNFQTMVSDLAGLPIANASLLDEGTAAAEAMNMFYHQKNKRQKDQLARKFFVEEGVLLQTVEVLKGRSQPLDIELVVGSWKDFDFSDSYFGALLQYPNSEGAIEDYQGFTEKCHDHKIFVCAAADLMSLVLCKSPGEWGADAVVGNTQRFGVPLGFGGPHAGYFATKEEFKRQIPGRIIGVSVDVHGKPALRMALQTREQHIKRERATSNICTAQALLAIMAGMYAVYHGPTGLMRIAARIHQLTCLLSSNLKRLGLKTEHDGFFDTLYIKMDENAQTRLQQVAISSQTNFYYHAGGIQISIDETCNEREIQDIFEIFKEYVGSEIDFSGVQALENQIPAGNERTSAILTHPVFSSYRTETSMMRYLKRLENRDLSLMHSMIPLGSCTMKLNAASELMPLSWPEFSGMHPFVPKEQYEGYSQIFQELSQYLCEITGFPACSLQPNSGAQGELAGLLVIKAYHKHRSDDNRKIALIPSSAHGTNPASAIMAGMRVVVVKCDENGNIDVEDLKIKAEQHTNELAALMVTYPSTHGVFEEEIVQICDIIHNHGGLVYMDGANMNAQVGLTNPSRIGADVCHLNLHKTFAIPHGGGGPGMGPICVIEKLAPFLPGHVHAKTGGKNAIAAIAAAPWGSASILLISYAYIRLLGKAGVTKASEIAILNANYIKSRLEDKFDILYVGKQGRVAHELIVDLRSFKSWGVSAEDIAKRLIDYGFHAPTLSFPVAGTIMIEPTESENKDELDRFCFAMLEIRKEVEEVRLGKYASDSNVLSNAPHSLQILTADEWNYSYSREKAGYPLSELKINNKFWSPVSRIDNAFGDRNLVCICPPMEVYEEEFAES